MKINREQLLNELELVAPGLSSREIIEQSSCFIFKDKQVVTFNDDVACFHTTCLDIEGAVKAIPLLNILRKMSEDVLDITCEKGDEGHQLTIRGKRRECGVVMEAEVLLPIDIVEKVDVWKKLPEEFSEAVGIVKDCAGKDETQFNLTCIHIHPKWIEACDSYQLTRYKLKTGVTSSILIRKESLKHIQSLGMDEFGETESWIHFKNTSGLILSCRRYVEDYDDLSEILNFKGTPTVLPKGLVEAAEKAEIFSKENTEDDHVTIMMKQNKLMLQGKGVNGYYREKKKIKYDGKEIKFTVSPSLLVKLIQKHNECELTEDRLKVDGGKFVFVTCLGSV